jgi:hypothetical protein
MRNTRASRPGEAQIAVWVSVDVQKRTKSYAAANRQKLGEVVQKALEEFLVNRATPSEDQRC